MTNMQETVRKNVVRAAVQRQITCPESGEILDTRRAVLLTNKSTGAAAIVTAKVFKALRPRLIASGGTFEAWFGADGREELIG